MRTVLSILALGLSSVLVGCVAGTTESIDDGDVAGEDVGEAEQAIGTCYGESCNNLDPGATGCESDAITVKSQPILSGSAQIGTIAIRYSPSCSAAWARTSTSFGSSYLRSEIARNKPTSRQAFGASPTPTTAQRSPMLGVTAGATFSAVGRIGPSYNYYPYVATTSNLF